MARVEQQEDKEELERKAKEFEEYLDEKNS